MTMLRRGRHVAGVVLVALAAGPLGTQPLAMMSRIEPGLWAIKTDAATEREICAPDPARLVQIQHEGSACTRLVIASSETMATVHYSCPGAGWGRTTLKYSTPRSIAIDTQGIADNAPFAYSGTAHRIGDCKSSPSGVTPAAAAAAR